MAVNNGILFEKKAISLSRTGMKDADVSRDYVTDKGTRIEVKFFTVKETDNYKKGHAVVNSANGHAWERDENGNIDYLASVAKFANECDVLKIGVGKDWEHCEVYWLRTKTDIYNFYFCRVQYRDEKTCRLCYNPISTKAKGRKGQLETLKSKGVVNVPTFEEIEVRHKPLK